MNKNKLFTIRVYFTGFVTFGIWMLLLWNYYHGGVSAHHILHREDLPAISNWWGGFILPLLTWFLLYRIQKRIIKDSIGNSFTTKCIRNIVYGFAGGLLFGILLSIFFTLDYSNISSYMVIGLFLIALILPIYRSEYLLGFVIGMTFIFGAVLPTVFGSLIALLSMILYKYVRPLILRISGKKGFDNIRL